MNEFIKVLIFLLLIDGIKLFFDSLAVLKIRKKNKKSIKIIQKKEADMNKISVCISAYRTARTISLLVDSLILVGFVPKNIHIVNDGSPDDMWKSLQKIKHSINIYNEPNKGKVEALKWLVEKVKTKYLLISDSDNLFPENFSISTELFKKGFTASSFNVVPFSNNSNVLVNLQKYEYQKSMAFSKEAKAPTGSVLCISGALGFYKTKRFREHGLAHSGEWSGEDLQFSLREQNSGGKITHTDSEIYTECPNKFKTYVRQRFIGWGPGSYHCMPLVFSILFKKGKNIQLRYDVLYDIATTLLDPFKIISFFYLLFTKNFELLEFVYVVYFFIELIIMIVLKNKIKISILFLYPLYNFGTILLKVASFSRFFVRRFITKKTKPLVLTLILILVLPFFGNAQNKKREKVISLSNQSIIDFKTAAVEKAYNLNLYAGYKTWYLESDFIINQSISFGKYYGNSYASMKYRENDLSFNLFQYLKILRHPNNLYVNFRAIYEFKSKQNIFLGGLTYERYVNDYNVFQVSVIRETGRLEDYMFKAKYKYKKIFSIGAGINNFGHKNFAATYSYCGFNFVVAYEENFDYTNFDRLILSVGYLRKF